MSVDVTAEVIIQRPRAEVFRFVTDVSQDTHWTSGLLEARKVTDGPFAAGTRIARTSKFLGRRFSYTIDIQRVEPDALVEMVTSAGPFPMTIYYQLDDQAGGTRMRIRALGEPGGVLLAGGPLARPLGASSDRPRPRDAQGRARVWALTPLCLSSSWGSCRWLDEAVGGWDLYPRADETSRGR